MVHRIVVQVGVILWAIKVFDGSSIIEVSLHRVLDFFMGHIFSGFVFDDSCFLSGLCLKSINFAFPFAV